MPLLKLTIVTEQLSQEQVKEVTSHINKAIEKGKEFIKQAQEKIEQSTNTY
jgi:ABC-type taurine transport system substrate-binding protein